MHDDPAQPTPIFTMTDHGPVASNASRLLHPVG